MIGLVFIPTCRSILGTIAATNVWRSLKGARILEYGRQEISSVVFSKRSKAVDRPPMRNPGNHVRLAGRGSGFQRKEAQDLASYESWSGQIPMTKESHDLLCALAGNTTPISALLITTSPPSIGMTKDGPVPIVTQLKTLTTLEDMQNLPQSDSNNVVADFHNHSECLELLEHDARLFRRIDNLLGPKLHIIGSKRGLRIYATSNHDPAVFNLRENEERRWR